MTKSYISIPGSTLVARVLLNAQGISRSFNKKIGMDQFNLDWGSDHTYILLSVLANTHLNNSFLEADVKADNSNPIHTNRTGRKRRGAGIYLHVSFTADVNVSFTNRFCVSVS